MGAIVDQPFSLEDDLLQVFDEFTIFLLSRDFYGWILGKENDNESWQTKYKRFFIKGTPVLFSKIKFY
jgi:hypothetical protein